MGAKPASQSYVMHKAIGKNVSYLNPVSSYYLADGPNTLTDGVRGTMAVGKYWHGFSGKDLIGIIDLGSEISISSMSLGCLQNSNDWIFMPQWVKFEVSEDGMNFKEVKTIQNPISLNEKQVIHTFAAQFTPVKAKFVRVTAKVLGSLPKGHGGEGKPGWLFADEFVIQ